MNGLENWFCGTNFWRNITQRRLLPWMLAGSDAGDSVLELGAGAGAATSYLREKFTRITSLEYCAAFAERIASDARQDTRSQEGAPSSAPSTARLAQVGVVQGDATQLPFASGSFSCVLAILVLHHLRSRELQEHALTEAFRVLRPGGVFLAVEIHDGWLPRLVHTRSTFVPFAASSANNRLNAAGFARVAVDFMRGGFLLRAQRGVD
jgi:ubiquinone/menaquinone biosynthesis C-methylase UbiE